MADNTIALQTMLPKFDTPAESQGKVLQLRAMQQADQQAQYQQQQQAQAMQDDASYRQALQSSGGDSQRMLSALAGAGNYGGYAKAQAADLAQRKGNTDIDKDKATTQKTQFDVLKDANAMVGSAAGALKSNPTYENAVGLVGQLKQRLGPDMSQKLGLDTLQIPNDPAAIAQWADQHYLASIDTDKQMADATKKSEGKADRAQQDTNSRRSAATSIANNTANIAKDYKVNGMDANGNFIGSSDGVSPFKGLVDEIGTNQTAQSVALARMSPGIRSQILAEVRKNYPDYDVANFAARNAAIKNFTDPNSKAAVQLQASNTALNHLDTIQKLADAQKNGDILLFNKIANEFALQTGKAAPKNMRDAALMVGPEISKSVVGATGGTGERGDFVHALGGDYSPDAITGTVSTMKELLGGRLAETERTYQRSTGRKDFRSDAYLSPAAQEILNSRGGGSSLPATNKQGWTLHVDASGNKAYVSPDGKQYTEAK